MKKAKMLPILLSLSLAASLFGSCVYAQEAEETTVEEAVEEEMDYAAIMAAAAEEAAAQAAEDAALAAAADEQLLGGTLWIGGYEWGPAVEAVILEFGEEVNPEEIDLENILVSTNSVRRTVLDAVSCDADKNVTEGPSKYICLALQTDNTANGNPFVYDFMVTMQNDWAETYPVIACVKAGDKTYGFNADLINNRYCPVAELFTNRGEFNGDYVNPMTGETDNLTLRYAAYEPAALAEDGAANPLIIWLHGQGEGGIDPDITLLGNETTALALPEIQSHFTTEGGEGGAYVLAVQCETYWMDGGDGTNSSGDIDSRYTQILMDTIQSYVDAHEDVDVNRIYLGGCSNGGFMTMNMLVSFPDYWAAAYPNCEAYAFNKISSNSGEGSAMGGANEFEESSERWMTDEKIEAIKNIPIWFAQSADDTIVDPKAFGLPTYQALLKAGATNAWFSFFETVQGKDDPTAQYMGHWVWTYLFNDAITAAQDPAAIVDAQDELFGFVPTNEGGGTISPEVNGVSYSNIFDWLNAQKKA